MVSVIVSRHLQSGEVMVLRICPWDRYEMPEDRQDDVEGQVVELRAQLGQDYEVVSGSAPTLLEFFQTHPQYTPGLPRAKEVKS